MMDADSFVKLADSALYKAKKSKKYYSFLTGLATGRVILLETSIRLDPYYQAGKKGLWSTGRSAGTIGTICWSVRIIALGFTLPDDCIGVYEMPRKAMINNFA